MIRTLCIVLSLSTVASAPAWGAKNAPIAGKLVAVGDASIVQAFDKPLDSTPAAVAKGEWKVVDGILLGKELAADKHAAVLNYQIKNRDSAVKFSFKLDGSTSGFNFSLNHAKGHLFRAVVTANGLSINLDKDKSDPASKAVVLATAKGSFEQGQWYTMLIEMKGNSVAVQTDNGLSVSASHDTLDTEKPNYRFVMKGDSLSLDDLMIWNVK